MYIKEKTSDLVCMYFLLLACYNSHVFMSVGILGT